MCKDESKKDICYICCNPGADDKDHVIPGSFFTKPKPELQAQGIQQYRELITLEISLPNF
jgi:hypothetical protein